MAIEIVDLPIKNGDFPMSYVKLQEGNSIILSVVWTISLAPKKPTKSQLRGDQLPIWHLWTSTKSSC